MAIKYVKRLAGPYVGVGQTTFTFSFLIYEASDVYVGTAMSEAERTSVLEINTDYTVTMNADQQSTPGGTVTLKTPLVEGQIVVIGSDLDYEQFLQLTNFSRFPPELVNKALDRLCIQIQQIVEKMGRTLSVPATSSETPESMIERLLKAQNEAKQYADNASDSADEAKQYAQDAKDYRDETSEYAETAKTLEPIKNEIAAVAGIKDQTETVGNNMAAVNAVAADIDTEMRDGWVDYGVYGEGGGETPVPVGGNILTVATNIENVNKVAENMESILSIEGKIDGLDETIATMDQQVKDAKDASNSAQAAAKTAAFAYRYSATAITANSSATLTQLVPNDNIKVGDHVMDVNGDIFELTAVSETQFTVGAKQTSLMGPKGDEGDQGIQGPQGDPGPQGVPGEKGDPGTTNYNDLANKPTLGALASKDKVGASDLEDYIDLGVYS